MQRSLSLLAFLASALTEAMAQTPAPPAPGTTGAPGIPVPAATDLPRAEEQRKTWEIHAHTTRTGVAEQPEIELLLRLPQPPAPVDALADLSVAVGSSSPDTSAMEIKGTLVYCTWEMDPARLRAFLSNEKHPVVRWADQQGLAILTFDTATLWQSRTSTRELSLSARNRQNYRFDRIAAVWDRAARALCRRHQAPSSDFFIYGISRGAHYAHRLVVRYPERFAAAHLHVANSYDIPTKHCDKICWLITTGDLDPGRDESMRLYRELLAAGYPILYRCFFGMGHGSDHRVDELRSAFFEYVLELRRDGSQDPEKEGETAHSLLRQQIPSPAWVADSLNDLVYPVSAARRIPREQTVPLPGQSLVKHWGKPMR